MMDLKTKPFDPAEYLDGSESIAAYKHIASVGLRWNILGAAFPQAA
jgi:hypothetical protein